jgi:hypothetical protein
MPMPSLKSEVGKQINEIEYILKEEGFNRKQRRQFYIDMRKQARVKARHGK